MRYTADQTLDSTQDLCSSQMCRSIFAVQTSFIPHVMVILLTRDWFSSLVCFFFTFFLFFLRYHSLRRVLVHGGLRATEQRHARVRLELHAGSDVNLALPSTSEVLR